MTRMIMMIADFELLIQCNHDQSIILKK